MPNKEKSVKTVPKTNGTADSLQNDTMRSESASDVIATDVKKGTINKKKDKHKNKEAIKANNSANSASAPENGTVDSAAAAACNNDVDDEIRAVSEELLKRLQCNGTYISVCKPTDDASAAKKCDNSMKSTSSADKLQSQQQSKQLNNNNNSKAHNKNCQNQNKTAKSVNISSNHTEICLDGIANVQCNGTHAATVMATVDSAIAMDVTNSDSSTRLPSPGRNPGTSKIQASESTFQIQTSSPEQPTTATTSKEILIANASCSHHQLHSNLPSTSNAVECKHLSLPKSALSVKSIKTDTVEVTFKEYENELQMPDIMRVIQRELSEPYSIYTYRYFIHNWPKLCFLAMDGENCIGAIVCKLDIHRQMTKRGYIAMLAVDAAYRKLKVGTTLVQKAIEAMLEHNADEVVLETEITNIPALRLYENLGFVRDKRLFDYYLNGVDALRLKLWFK